MASSKTKTVSHPHPDHSAELTRLRKITGQVAGIERMIQERRYCPEIVQQIRAATSALRAIEISILTEHLNQCLIDAARSRETETFNRKIAELIRLIKG